MNSSISNSILEELHTNPIFKVILDDFSFPRIDSIDTDVNLAYESNEYMGYYKKDFYFDLIPRDVAEPKKCILKLTLVSNNKKFDIEKAMHLDQTDANNTVSATFKVYGDKTDWDIVRYSYTLWK